MGIVETDIPAEVSATPETPSEWFDHNVRATFHALIDNVTLRSEQESSTLHALVDGLDKDPQEIIAKLEIAPIAGGAGTVDPVLAQVIADNASLRADVKKLLDALTANASDTATPEIAADVAQVQGDLETPAPVAPAPVAVNPSEVTSTETISNPDGSTTTHFSDGTSQTVAPDGSVIDPTDPAPIPPQVPGA